MAVKNILPSTDLKWCDIRDTLNAHGGKVGNFIQDAFCDGTTQLNAPVPASHYGLCETAASTAAKTVSIDDVSTLTQGLIVHIRFMYTNSATGQLTLNINSLGAKNISAHNYVAGQYYSFLYNGTSFVMCGYRGVTYKPNANINKWSKNKPMAIDTTEDPSVAQMRQVNYGLSIPFPTSINDIFGLTDRVWGYTMPDGSDTQPYRFADYKGYKPNAIAPRAYFEPSDVECFVERAQKITFILNHNYGIKDTAHGIAYDNMLDDYYVPERWGTLTDIRPLGTFTLMLVYKAGNGNVYVKNTEMTLNQIKQADGMHEMVLPAISGVAVGSIVKYAFVACTVNNSAPNIFGSDEAITPYSQAMDSYRMYLLNLSSTEKAEGQTELQNYAPFVGLHISVAYLHILGQFPHWEVQFADAYCTKIRDYAPNQCEWIVRVKSVTSTDTYEDEVLNTNFVASKIGDYYYLASPTDVFNIPSHEGTYQRIAYLYFEDASGHEYLIDQKEIPL